MGKGPIPGCEIALKVLPITGTPNQCQNRIDSKGKEGFQSLYFGRKLMWDSFFTLKPYFL